MSEKLEDLANKVKALRCSERLLIASQLVLDGKLEIAESIANNAVEELAAKRLFGMGNPR